MCFLEQSEEFPIETQKRVQISHDGRVTGFTVQ